MNLFFTVCTASKYSTALSDLPSPPFIGIAPADESPRLTPTLFRYIKDSESKIFSSYWHYHR